MWPGSDPGVLCCASFRRLHSTGPGTHPPGDLSLLCSGGKRPRAGIWPASGTHWGSRSRASCSKPVSNLGDPRPGAVWFLHESPVGCLIPRLILGAVGYPTHPHGCCLLPRTPHLHWSWWGQGSCFPAEASLRQAPSPLGASVSFLKVWWHFLTWVKQGSSKLM